MSRLAWLTPEDAPGTALCRTVFIPAGLHYEAAFRGAYLILCNPENWEQTGAQTPEACAAAFQDAFFQTLENWAVCPEVIMPIVGEIRTFACPPPTGWLYCSGGTRNIANYPDLWDALNIHFGGDGITTFGLPDLRGRFQVGTGDNGESSYDLADAGGEDYHTLTLAETPTHNHLYRRADAAVAIGTDVSAHRGTSVNWTERTGSEGGGALHENRPPFLALNFAIYAGEYVP